MAQDFTHSTDPKQAELVSILREIRDQVRCNGHQLSQITTQLASITNKE